MNAARLLRNRRVVAVIVILAAVLVGSTLNPSGLFSAHHAFSVRALAPHTSGTDPLGVSESKVFGTSIPARVYGTMVGRQEDQGLNARGEMISDLSPIPAAAFKAPVAAYKRYAARWLARVAADTDGLAGAVRAGSRPAAKSAWEATWAAYLHLGAVYGLFGALDQKIDGMPGGLPGGVSSRRFSGLHRIEMGLWGGAPVHSLTGWVARLAADAARLRRVIPHVSIAPLDYATRAHEILEDAQRDLLSGVDVPWSGEGVLGTAAGLAATQEVVRTLNGLLGGRENTQIEVQNNLVLMGRALDRIRREHGGAWPTLGQLSVSQRELLDGTLAGALSALEQLPGTLETKPIETIPNIPAGHP